MQCSIVHSEHSEAGTLHLTHLKGAVVNIRTKGPSRDCSQCLAQGHWLKTQPCVHVFMVGGNQSTRTPHMHGEDIQNLHKNALPQQNSNHGSSCCEPPSVTHWVLMRSAAEVNSCHSLKNFIQQARLLLTVVKPKHKAVAGLCGFWISWLYIFFSGRNLLQLTGKCWD